MTASPYGIDVAKVYKDREAITGAKLSNEMNRRKLKADDDRQQLNKQMKPIRAKAAMGNQSAQDTLIALDPENGPQFVESLQNISKTRLEELDGFIDRTGAQTAALLQIKDPQERELRYQEFRQSMPEQFQQRLPQQFDERRLTHQLGTLTAMDQLTSEYKSVRFGGEDVLTKGGKIVGKAKRPLKGGSGKQEMGGIKSSDMNTIAKGVARAMGGDFRTGPNGELVYVGLGDEVEREALAITARAAEIFKQGGTDHASAQVKAMREFGKNIPQRPPSTSRQQTSRFRYNPQTKQVEELR